MRMFNLCKFFIITATFSAQFLLGQGFIAALKDVYIFNPGRYFSTNIEINDVKLLIRTHKRFLCTRKGCVACIKSADKHFLKGVISLKSSCSEAKKKYTKFKALGSTSYYMFHVCKEDNEVEYQSRLKAMAAKAKEVMESFGKCAILAMDFGQKSAIRDLWEKFENEREKCGGTKHLTSKNEKIQEFQDFWAELPYTGIAEAVWGVTPENVNLISNLIV